MSKSNISFKDYSVSVKNVMTQAGVAFLHEAAGEVESEVKAKTRVDTAKTKASWQYQVDEADLTAYVGSDDENAIWEEYGTGEYALQGNGRKGKWYVHESQLTKQAQSKMKRVYGKNGNVYYETSGKRPQRTLYNAFNSKSSAIEKRAKELFKGMSNT